MKHIERLVVIGNGMAGGRFVEELTGRNGQEHFDVVVFGEEPHGNYNRILLSSVVAGSHEVKDIFLNSLEWYRDNGITVHAGVRVDAINRDSKLVFGPRRVREPYDRLIFATGSKPFVPPIQGLMTGRRRFRDGIFVFRTLDDAIRILKHAKKVRNAVVFGRCRLRLEAARGLWTRVLGIQVLDMIRA